jgi:hypothetical protein
VISRAIAAAAAARWLSRFFSSGESSALVLVSGPGKRNSGS